MSGLRTISTACVRLSVAAAVLLVCVSALADDDERQKAAEDMQNYRFKTVTTPEGLHFRIPEDMPIETKNGLKGPIPYDEYQYYKMRKLEEKMIEVDKKLDRFEQSTAKSFKSLENHLEKLELRSQNHPQTPVEQPPTQT